MTLLSYVKVPATHYALHFQQGQLRREGLGLSFFFYEPNSTIAAIPMGSTDAPFAFVEATSDFQQATVQGQLTYRVADPKKVESTMASGGCVFSDGVQQDSVEFNAGAILRVYRSQQKARLIVA